MENFEISSLEKNLSDLSVAVQAGGESKRMGTSKATVLFLGEPLIMRSVRRLFPICNEMIITTNEPEKLGFLQSYIDSGRLKLVVDKTSKRGALIGMRTALFDSQGPYVALVACDMVFPSPDLIRYLLAKLKREDGDVAIPKTRFGYEPFHAVYRKDTCLRAVDAALSKGCEKATSWFDSVKVIEVEHDEIVNANPSGGAFVNVNTPKELHDLEQRLRLE